MNKYSEGLTELLTQVGNVSSHINSGGDTTVYADCLRDMQRAQIAAVHRTGREFSTADAMVTGALEAIARLSSTTPNFGHALGLANAALVLADHLRPEQPAEKAETVESSPELSDAQLRKVISGLAEKLMENHQTRENASLGKEASRADERTTTLTKPAPQSEASRRLAERLEGAGRLSDR